MTQHTQHRKHHTQKATRDTSCTIQYTLQHTPNTSHQTTYIMHSTQFTTHENNTCYTTHTTTKIPIDR